MNKIDYPYSNGDKLKNRNTYFYSLYAGEGFLDSFYSTRLKVKDELGEAKCPAYSVDREYQGITDKGVNTEILLQSLTGMIHANCMNLEGWGLVAKLIQRFEVSKRLFPEYGLNWRAVNSSDYFQYDLYLLFAFLMEAAYSCRAGLTELNVLLKVMDSLISIRQLLNADQKAYLVWLINRELEFVRELRGSLEANL